MNGTTGQFHCPDCPSLSRPSSRPGQIKTVNEICAPAKRLGTVDMVDHCFLDASRRIQRTTFADGTQITADFTKKTYSISGSGSR